AQSSRLPESALGHGAAEPLGQGSHVGRRDRGLHPGEKRGRQDGGQNVNDRAIQRTALSGELGRSHARGSWKGTARGATTQHSLGTTLDASDAPGPSRHLLSNVAYTSSNGPPRA